MKICFFAIAFMLQILKCYPQNYFNELFSLDTTIILKERDHRVTGIFGTVATCYKNLVIFTDFTRRINKNDSIPFISYHLENKQKSYFNVITNNEDLVDPKNSSIQSIAFNNSHLFISVFKRVLVFKKIDTDFYIEKSLDIDSDYLEIVNDSILVSTKTNNPYTFYFIYDFFNDKVIEEKKFKIDVVAMAHIAPSKYIDAFKNDLYFIDANKYNVIKYNFYNHKYDTIIKHNPEKWKPLSNNDVKKINNTYTGAPSIKKLKEILPEKNIIHGLEVINDTTIIVRHLWDYYGKNMEFFVDVWEYKNGYWELSISCLKYKSPNNLSLNISKDNFPIFLYNSFFYNNAGVYFTISENETTLSPIGLTYDDYYNQNQNSLISQKPVYKLNIFYKK